MALPHLLRNQKYLDFYRSRVELDDFVIMDNGAAEGVTFGERHLHTLAEEFNPNEIVVPDVIGDVHATLDLAVRFAKHAKADEYRYMFVLQGRTMQQLIYCLDTVARSHWSEYISTIGVPRHVLKQAMDRRCTLTEYFVQEGLEERFDLHYLGAGRWMTEVIALADIGVGRGIDTSLPIYMGLEELTLTSPYISRHPEYFDATYTNKYVDDNVRTYLQWAKYTT